MASEFAVAVIVLIGMTLYLLPSLVAGMRHHHNQMAIFIMNLFLGWTLLGWVGSLVWACTQVVPAVVASAPGPRQLPTPPWPQDLPPARIARARRI